MSKVAVMMSADRPDKVMSSHFSKAEWIMVADTKLRGLSFLKNERLQCNSVVDVVLQQGCDDVIFADIGNGAFQHFNSAGIRGWVAPANISGQQALEMFEHLRLQPAQSATEQHGGRGCCCTKPAGAEATSCCRN